MPSVFDYNKFLKETFSSFDKNNGQRIGQYVFNKFRVYKYINIPDDCDCFYDDKKLTKFLEYIQTFDGCLIM